MSKPRGGVKHRAIIHSAAWRRIICPCERRGDPRVALAGAKGGDGQPRSLGQSAARLDKPCLMVSPATHNESDAKLITVRPSLRSPVNS